MGNTWANRESFEQLRTVVVHVSKVSGLQGNSKIICVRSKKLGCIMSIVNQKKRKRRRKRKGEHVRWDMEYKGGKRGYRCRCRIYLVKDGGGMRYVAVVNWCASSSIEKSPIYQSIAR